MKRQRAYIKEHGIAIGVSVISINTVKSLWKLNVTHMFPKVGVHQETHGFSQCLTVVYVVITIKIQQERSISEDS